jgi:hypothetical protein
VLELLAHGADEDGAHGTSRRRRTNRLDSAGAAIIVRRPESAEIIYRWRAIRRLLS